MRTQTAIEVDLYDKEEQYTEEYNVSYNYNDDWAECELFEVWQLDENKEVIDIDLKTLQEHINIAICEEIVRLQIEKDNEMIDLREPEWSI